MLRQLYLCLVVVILAVHSRADLPKCNRKVNLIDNYDKTKITGVWYVVEVGDENKSKKKCLTADITGGKGDAENSVVLKESGIIDSKPKMLEVSLDQVKSTSLYVTQASEFPKTLAWVIGTDYDSYATWFLCRNGHAQDGVLFVTTRERKPSKEVLKRAHDSITKEGFKIGKADLFPVDHTNC